MKRPVVCLLFAGFALNLLLAPLASAKDELISLAQCPAPVQAVIRHYSQQGSLDSIGLDRKTKSGGPAVYEAKFTVKDGKRVEVHISPEGKVIQMENKKTKQ